MRPAGRSRGRRAQSTTAAEAPGHAPDCSHGSLTGHALRARGPRCAARPRPLSNERVQVARVKTGLTVVLATQFQGSESVFVGRQRAAEGLVQVNERAFDGKVNGRRLGRVVGYHQRMSFACGLIDEGAGPGYPVMLEVAPVACERVAAYGAHVIVHTQLRPWQPLEHRAEAARCDVEAAWLDPHAFGVRNPAARVVNIDVRDEMATVSLLRSQAIGETAEGCDRHGVTPDLTKDVRPHARGAGRRGDGLRNGVRARP